LARNTYRRSSQKSSTEAANKVILVGSPNVGKSLIFNRLSGAYVTVSNYPGTTVEVTRARAKLDGAEYELLDTLLCFKWWMPGT
jgi:ferrous iron transport protein B